MHVRILRIVLISTIVTSCGNIAESTGSGVVGVDAGDAEMNAAIEKANASLDEFTDALKSGNKDYSDFAVKIKVPTDNGDEHIWISEVSMEGDSLTGLVDNLPEYASNLKLWDLVTIDPKDISDWMYTRHDTLAGGFTVRVLRNRMTEEEREQFDAETELIIN